MQLTVHEQGFNDETRKRMLEIIEQAGEQNKCRLVAFRTEVAEVSTWVIDKRAMSLGFRQELLRRVRRHQFHPDEPYTPLRDATHDLKKCLHCGSVAQRMQKCSGCRWARYCTFQCQKADWRKHKRICCPDHCLESDRRESGPFIYTTCSAL